MRQLIFLISVVLAISFLFSSVAALQCHECMYLEDESSSDERCESKPAVTVTCTKSKAANLSLITGEGTKFLTMDMEMKQDEGSTYLCSKFTGELFRRKVVYRACGIGDASLAGKCFTQADGASMMINNHVATDVIGCLCVGNNCNGENENGDNGGASSLNFKFISHLIGTAIIILSKVAYD